MNEYTKNIELTYGNAKVIAKKASTTPQYVRTVLHRHKSGHRIYGEKAKKIMKLLLKDS